MQRSQARIGREQAGIDRAPAETGQGRAARRPGPDQAAQRSKALRKQAMTVIETFAAIEEEIARTFEQLAGSRRGRRDEYRQTAAQARASARRAHEILHAMASDLPPTP